MARTSLRRKGFPESREYFSHANKKLVYSIQLFLELSVDRGYTTATSTAVK